jgi:hypothetical protein
MIVRGLRIYRNSWGRIHRLYIYWLWASNTVHDNSTNYGRNDPAIIWAINIVSTTVAPTICMGECG